MDPTDKSLQEPSQLSAGFLKDVTSLAGVSSQEDLEAKARQVLNLNHLTRKYMSGKVKRKLRSVGGKSTVVLELGKNKMHQIGRNGQCPCGSGKKFKNCCLVN